METEVALGADARALARALFVTGQVRPLEPGERDAWCSALEGCSVESLVDLVAVAVRLVEDGGPDATEAARQILDIVGAVAPLGLLVGGGPAMEPRTMAKLLGVTAARRAPGPNTPGRTPDLLTLRTGSKGPEPDADE